MIEIIYRENMDRREIHVSGHAGAGVAGEDIVCASVSALVEFTSFMFGKLGVETPVEGEFKASLDRDNLSLDRDNLSLDRDNLSLDKQTTNNHNFEVLWFVLGSLAQSLKTLAESEPGYIKYKEASPGHGS